MFIILWLVLIAFERFLLIRPESPVPINIHINSDHCIYDDGKPKSKRRCLRVSSLDEPFTKFSPVVKSEIKKQPYRLKQMNIILFWTKYFGKEPFIERQVSIFEKLFKKINNDNEDIPSKVTFWRPPECSHKYPECLVTTDRSFLSQANSLIFHWRDLDPNDIPLVRHWNQSWILYNLESPLHTKMVDPSFNFNLVATYRSNSDLVITYGSIEKNELYRTVNHSGNVSLKNKTKWISWFVSHCNTPSLRGEYVDQLSRYISVDIYGACGKLSCNPPQSEYCYKMIERDYRFYLSFENSICIDYVTEKLWNIMQYDIIPVVYGGANYTHLLPPHSYIDATELRPIELAKKLTRIGNNPQLYNQYFKWKRFYHLEGIKTPFNGKLLCKLCHNMKLSKHNRKMKHYQHTAEKINSCSNSTTPTPNRIGSDHCVYDASNLYLEQHCLRVSELVEPLKSKSAVNQASSPNQLKYMNIILFWTSYFGTNPFYGAKSSLPEIFEKEDKNKENIPTKVTFWRPPKCSLKYPECLVTTDRSFLSRANSLIFHWRDLDPNDIPLVRHWNQSWTLFNFESPMNTLKVNPLFIFNLVATYRFDSDLVIRYGLVEENEFNNTKVHSGNVSLEHKTKWISWFVSNCYTHSLREKYVDHLSHYITVDIYGACGKLSCNPPQSDHCYKMIERDYRFYLSFENSICTDYATEKLWNIMQYDIIPIVYGGANYTHLLPPMSYIDATELRPIELANKLFRIGSNSELYNQYFKWKRQFHVKGTDDPFNSKILCKMCHHMKHNKEMKHQRTAKEINSWYFNNTCDIVKVKLF
ncbi:hypothetical protein RDWZM_007936 [Blomia tropicalis]|uniref:Fucosyltransferase n=1 Tax=Blomia tropicalis TaxID=40697 RepID=A0A9Q0M0F0_BLOTA|nr:hypothetical protein RDWZM_007936 [Blomia tropicalis]